MSELSPQNTHDRLSRLSGQLEEQISRLRGVQGFSKSSRAGHVLDLARRILAEPGGLDVLYRHIAALEEAGVFGGSDWAEPEWLKPSMAVNTIKLGDRQSVLLECLNDIRMLAIANGDYFHPQLSAEQAQHFLAQVLSLNLDLLFAPPSEAERNRLGALARSVRTLFAELIERVGHGHILDRLIDEVWRILAQRPILISPVKTMISQIAAYQANPDVETGAAGRGADRLVSALFSPTNGTRGDPGLPAYAGMLESMDRTAMAQEATGFARAMHDTGLVSEYHAVLLRFLPGRFDDLVPEALGLSGTGRDSLLCYQELVHALIDAAVHPETAQAIYGLALLLERGILHTPAVAPALWRQISLPLAPETEAQLAAVAGTARPAHVFLLAGVLSILGQPLGIGQGNNPTCQSARAISLWALNEPDYLLQLVAWAARDGEVVTYFERDRISSRELLAQQAGRPLLDVDAVSLVLVPHLDAIYTEMGRLCAGRGEDPHKWINPEFHGWWTGRGFAIAVDVGTGMLKEYESFLRLFYATYHPFYNGNQPIIHAQPAGLAFTDSEARFVGWHAISILRVALDQEGVMRIYFYNPNNDSGQDWGQGIVVSTEGSGERFGESSLPVTSFVSRLYIFHYDERELGDPGLVPGEEIAEAMRLGQESWAAERNG